MGDEYESFEITDYDLQNEFTGARKRRGFTKEQQIYGMWADTSDGEETKDTPSASRFRPTKGMSFIAGGIQQSGKEKKEKKEPEEDEDVQNYEPKPMFGTQIDSSDEEDNLPLELSRPRPSLSAAESLAGFRRGRGGGGKLGDWEKHTTGIGSKLMKMMGYKEGKGLGKNLQGISTPVEAQKRKGKGAIGFYGKEVGARRAAAPAEAKELDSEGEEGETGAQKHQWRKRSGGAKKVRYAYRTADDVIEAGKTRRLRPAADDKIAKTKVIDMTGPETRVLTSYHAIAAQGAALRAEADAAAAAEDSEEPSARRYPHFDVPELVHNVQLLLEKSEDVIVANARALEREQDRVVHLNHERERFEMLLGSKEAQMETLETALERVEAMETKHAAGTLTLREVTDAFTELRKESLDVVFEAYDLAYIAPTYVTPILRARFASWDPLKEPRQHIDVMAQWRSLIERDGSDATAEATMAGGEKNGCPGDPYHQMAWATWAASLRATVEGSWEPRECSPLVTVLEIWAPPLIPAWMHAHLLQAVVLPRITRAVHAWNPCQDTVPIHTWLHPWLPLLSDQLHAVYPVIRQKLSSALIHWHPSDRSAKMVLTPWKGVFSETSMTQLVQASVATKLEAALLEMPLSPHNQKLEAWHWFLDWEDLLVTQLLFDALERCFFPRWFQALGAWLSNNPPFGDVVKWYQGWRDLMPKKVASTLQVTQKFEQALQICQRALSFQAGAAEQFALLLGGFEKIGDPPPPPPPPITSSSSPSSRSSRTKDWADIISSGRRENLSMRELVEGRCHDRGIVFYLIPERTHAGRPVYRCGKINVSFSKNVIYVLTDGTWVPKGLNTMFDEATG